MHFCSALDPCCCTLHPSCGPKHPSLTPCNTSESQHHQSQLRPSEQALLQLQSPQCLPFCTSTPCSCTYHSPTTATFTTDPTTSSSCTRTTRCCCSCSAHAACCCATPHPALCCCETSILLPGSSYPQRLATPQTPTACPSCDPVITCRCVLRECAPCAAQYLLPAAAHPAVVCIPPQNTAIISCCSCCVHTLCCCAVPAVAAVVQCQHPAPHPCTMPNHTLHSLNHSSPAPFKTLKHRQHHMRQLHLGRRPCCRRTLLYCRALLLTHPCTMPIPSSLPHPLLPSAPQNLKHRQHHMRQLHPRHHPLLQLLAVRHLTTAAPPHPTLQLTH